MNFFPGDVGGARILFRLYSRTGMKAVYSTDDAGWWYWGGTRWLFDKTGAHIRSIFQRELESIQRIFGRESQSAEERDDDDPQPDPATEDASTFAVPNDSVIDLSQEQFSPTVGRQQVNFLSRARMSNLLSDCESPEFFGYSSFRQLLDGVKDILPVKNGVIDLRTATLLPHHPKKFMGYASTGHTNEQCLGMGIGGGSNGKTVTMHVLAKVLGPYYVEVPKELLVTAPGQRPAGKGNASPVEASLQGARLAVASETKKNDKLDEDKLKSATGNVTMTARQLYQGFMTWETSHQLMLLTNCLPQVEDMDFAVERRIIIFNFMKSWRKIDDPRFDPEDPFNNGVLDNTLLSKLTTSEALQEALVWIVTGAKVWYDSGMALGPQPADSRRALREYVHESDPFQRFLDEQATLDKNLRRSTKFTASVDIIGRYSMWLEEEENWDVPRIDGKGLKAQLGKRGLEYTNKPTRGYKGIELKAREHNDASS
ncbi:hypothetical protein KFL_002930010 [Klebsormidium nitens]|uniref:SF3 helicase domain-containing protein n=1 Tax=Klebsormidium nitens TaxID=105231 RepID=A0A1Y1I6B8_KLENI|nr:hypothetical protein KFL_002930010 [Klebsormidium nitens]|eukprot:GAQ86504.1 hypothetical protein KFL_002930010 [Klebsormidium nitens]